MDLETSQPAAPAPEITSHADLAKAFEAELIAERAPPAAPQAKTPPEKVETPDEQQDTNATPDESAAESETESEGDTPDDTATAETDDAAETPSDDQSIAAPSGMSDADKAVYAKLPTELKAWVAKQESARTADYTRKTQVLSAHKKQLDEGFSGVQQRLRSLDAELARFTDNDIAPPDPALRMTDPAAYDDGLAYYMQAQHNKEIAAKKRQEIAVEFGRNAEALRNQFHSERAQELKALAPELFGAKGEEIGRQIQKYAMQSGYTTEQLDGASAKDIVTLWKAQRYDAIEAAKKQVKTVAPPAPKSVKPGPARVVGRPNAVASAMKTFETKPSRENLAAVYLAEIQSEKR